MCLCVSVSVCLCLCVSLVSVVSVVSGCVCGVCGVCFVCVMLQFVGRTHRIYKSLSTILVCSCSRLGGLWEGMLSSCGFKFPRQPPDVVATEKGMGGLAGPGVAPV